MGPQGTSAERWLANRRALLLAKAGLAFAAGLALFAYFGQGPILLQFQGTHLVHAAHALTEGRGLEIEPGVPLAKFGPLYALLLAPLELAGFSVGAAAYLINSITLAASFLGLATLGRQLGLRLLVNGGSLFMWAVWAPNLYLLRAVRPDAIPITMALFMVPALVRFASTGSRTQVALAAGACSLAALSRYMALFTLLPVGAVAVWLWSPSPRRRLFDTALFGLIAGLPTAAWLVRNRVVTGFFTGMSRFEERGVRSETPGLLENLETTFETLALDAFSYESLGVRLQEGVPAPPDLQWSLMKAAAAALAIGIALWYRRQGPPMEPRSNESRSTGLASAFIAVYLTALVAIWSVGNNDPINTRYVAPIYPFAIALVWRLAQPPWATGLATPRLAVAAVIVLAVSPNLFKLQNLWGPVVNEHLIELRQTERRPTNWRHAIDWDDVHRFSHPQDLEPRRPMWFERAFQKPR